MKRLSFCVALVCSILAVFTAITFAAQGKLTICMEDKEDFPNIMGSGTALAATNPGVAVEFVQLVAQKLDLSLEIKRMNWNKCIKEDVNSGAMDGAMPASHSKEREAFAEFPRKGGQPDQDRMYAALNYAIYKKDGSPIEWDGKEFKNAANAIAGTKPGYSIIPMLKGIGLQVNEAPTADNLKKLLDGQIQMVIDLELESDRQLAANPDFAVGIEKIAIPYVSRPNYLILSKQFIKKNPALAEKIWNTVGEVRKSDYSRILRKYFSK